MLGGLVVFPILYNIWLSFFDKHAFLPVQAFVGLGHYRYFASDAEFWSSFRHGVVYAGATMVLQIGVGVPSALLLNKAFRGRALLRGVVLFPYMIPTIVAVMLWKWLLNDTYGLINYVLTATHLAAMPVAWLGPDWIMTSLVVTSVWQFFPFVVVTYLARLQTIPPELYEAATIDGAGRWGRFRYVTLPLLMPIIFIVTMFSVIFTFADFQLIYVLTRGGPANATHVFATYAFDIAMGAGQFGQGAAIALSMVPPLALIILAMAIYMRPSKS